MEMFRRVRGPVALATCLVICSSAGIAAETKPVINLDSGEENGSRLRSQGEAGGLENEHRCC